MNRLCVEGFCVHTAAPECSWEHLVMPSPSFALPATPHLRIFFSVTSVGCRRGSWSYWCTKLINWHGNWEAYAESEYCSSPFSPEFGLLIFFPSLIDVYQFLTSSLIEPSVTFLFIYCFFYIFIRDSSERVRQEKTRKTAT